MYSAETAVMLLDQLHQKKQYGDLTPHRPLFGYFSATTGVNSMLDIFGPYMTVPMRTYPIGVNPTASKVIPGFPSESRAAYSWRTNTNYYATSTYAFNPMTGANGISCHTQLGTTVHTDLNEDGLINFNSSTITLAFGVSGVIVGEPGYRQGLNLCKNDGSITVGSLNSRSPTVINATYATPWSDITGLRRLFTGGTTYGYGDIGYNRLTNTLAFIERGNTYSYRLHIFKGLPKLKADILQIKAALNAAGANTATYETFDFVWPGVDNIEWHDGTRIIPCDDGSFWLARMQTNSGLMLATIGAPPSNGARPFAMAGGLGNGGNTSYGREQSTIYGIRHMNSDNGEIVAVYCPYYYYLAGALLYFLSRRSINWTKVDCTFSSTSYGYSIAPAGGSNFVVDDNRNNDGRSSRCMLMPLDAMVAQGTVGGIASVDNYLSISGYGGSTNPGPNGLIKVQPSVHNTTEFKERNL